MKWRSKFDAASMLAAHSGLADEHDVDDVNDEDDKRGRDAN